MQSEEAIALLRRYPECLATLQAYHAADVASRPARPESDGWLPRLAEIPEVPPERLSGVHGRLIAFGYLKFELSAKDATLRYQLTELARAAMTGETTEATAENDWAA
jgi:hypothetical protein